MAPDSWLNKVKSAIIDSVKYTMSPEAISARRKPSVEILAFEVSSLMSKLVHLWRTLSDAQISRLRHETIVLEGVRKIVSDDDSFLLSLACAELTGTLRLVAESTSMLSRRCNDPELRQFDRILKEFTDTGRDANRWVMTWKEMDAKAKKMDRYIASTAALYKELDDLSDAETVLKKLVHSSHNLNNSKLATISDMQQKIFWQRQEVKYLRQTSLWGCSFDVAISLLARSTCTVLARIKSVFGIGQETHPAAASLPRSMSVSAVVYPSSDTVSPRAMSPTDQCGLFESSSAMTTPPATTLGSYALALHYANVIVVIEKMIRMPRAVGQDARDDLYGMLPASLRGQLRARLKGVGWGVARDVRLAAEWKAAMSRIVEWLLPVAQSTIRWQGERSFERKSAAAAPRTNVLLLQTLYFANREKVEAAVAELLVGLNYVWRFEMEMCLDMD
ncbi:uncharacterized protein M6B38_315740 [Iris pallida]|uniref:Uncharacterized protein n=1 Tax=Iris pallida TaxID=29817 RepID=A0AAX6HDR8_IRIPA|nr:uncharacterized protein M6B38_315740 [Iris pallida]